MFIIQIISCILAILVSYTNAQSCKTPNMLDGECISLLNCKLLLDMFTNTNRSQQEKSLLTNSYCGSEKNVPKVCCPSSNACMTPGGEPGKCVGVDKCPQIMSLLQSGNTSDLTFIRNSMCKGPDKNSVCCGTPPTAPPPSAPATSNTTSEAMSLSPEKCALAMNTAPPAPSTECCGRDVSSNNKIMGGAVTKIDEYPWLVLIEYLDLFKIRTLCGGSLISGKYVLTAGHCVVGDIYNKGIPTNVRLGEYDTSTDKDCTPVEGGGDDCADAIIVVPIEKIIVHPSYKSLKYYQLNDIALLRIKDTAPYTDFIRPICLPSMDYTVSPPNELDLYTAGWGWYKQSGAREGTNSPIKRDVKLGYVNETACQAAERKASNGGNVNITNLQICAIGEPGKGTCKGDSGGPLMYKRGAHWEIVGVLSYGTVWCGMGNIPGVYTNVYQYLPWIKSVIVD